MNNYKYNTFRDIFGQLHKEYSHEKADSEASDKWRMWRVKRMRKTKPIITIVDILANVPFEEVSVVITENDQ